MNTNAISSRMLTPPFRDNAVVLQSPDAIRFLKKKQQTTQIGHHAPNAIFDAAW